MEQSRCVAESGSNYRYEVRIRIGSWIDRYNQCPVATDMLERLSLAVQSTYKVATIANKCVLGNDLDSEDLKGQWWTALEYACLMDIGDKCRKFRRNVNYNIDFHDGILRVYYDIAEPVVYVQENDTSRIVCYSSSDYDSKSDYEYFDLNPQTVINETLRWFSIASETYSTKPGLVWE